jgi:hypothetical protein
MRSVTGSLVAFTLVVGCHAGEERASGPVVQVGPGDNLRLALDTLLGPVTVALEPGDYHVRPVAITDPGCGNCDDGSEQVPATRGLRLRGRDVHLVGTSARDVVIHTGSGYGVLFDGCEACGLSRVTITDGSRDADRRATDAGVVVRDSQVTLTDCIIRDNLGDSATVQGVIVGVGGVAVREGGHATVRGCRIERNSWDGITAYRGGRLVATDNVVDGVDRATGTAHGGGRGVGIALTRGAEGVVEGNLVTRYWKGIGILGGARAHVRENIVEDVATWGITLSGPRDAVLASTITRNVVFETGACGVAVESDTGDTGQRTAGRPPAGSTSSTDRAGGSVRENLLVRTGQDHRYDEGEPYCPQRPIALHGVPRDFTVEGNMIHGVRQPGSRPRAEVLSRAAFLDAAREVLERIGSRAPLVESRFYGAFGSVP